MLIGVPIASVLPRFVNVARKMSGSFGGLRGRLRGLRLNLCGDLRR